ncbi:MAG: hypothetical protein LBT26_12340 [Clostridiales Family XIII bacterium]|nr:hypothetical protein [Clostridiales Family XIII bacterium]
MNISKAAIEKIKNVLLVVLVCSTILLLYFLWADPFGGNFRFPGAAAEERLPILVKEALNPDRITVSFGSENYTVLPAAGLWYGAPPENRLNFVGEMARFLAADGMVAGAVSKADFTEVMRARSIQVDFLFAMPLSDFCTEYDLRRPVQIDSIEAFTCIAYSEASPDSLFLCDKQEDRYYRLAAGPAVDDGFKALIAQVESQGYASFYPLRTYSGVENEVMIPLDMESAMLAVPYKSNIDTSDPEEAARITDMAKGFFGRSFDFTRKITEGNGVTVYMYGYGEKVLTINRDGSMEYSVAGGDTGTATYFEALELALGFIADHGGLAEPEMAARQIYLKDAEVRPEGRNVYRFSFGIKSGGYEVYYIGSEPFVVEVSGRRVTYYGRDMIDCSPAGAGSAWTKQACAPFDLLTEQFSYMYGVLSEADGTAPGTGAEAAGGPVSGAGAGKPAAEAGTSGAGIGMPAAETPEAVFDAVTGKVSNVSSGLLRPAPEAAALDGAPGTGADAGARGGLLPVWILTVEGIDFYFDLYTGERLGYS